MFFPLALSGFKGESEWIAGSLEGPAILEYRTHCFQRPKHVAKLKAVHQVREATAPGDLRKVSHTDSSCCVHMCAHVHERVRVDLTCTHAP